MSDVDDLATTFAKVSFLEFDGCAGNDEQMFCVAFDELSISFILMSYSSIYIIFIFCYFNDLKISHSYVVKCKASLLISDAKLCVGILGNIGF